LPECTGQAAQIQCFIPIDSRQSVSTPISVRIIPAVAEPQSTSRKMFRRTGPDCWHGREVGGWLVSHTTAFVTHNRICVSLAIGK